MTTTPAKLPALQPAASGSVGLDRWVQAVTERLEVREGQRGDPLEKVVTFRDLDGYSLSDITTFLATSGQGFLQKQGDGSYRYVSAEDLTGMLRTTKLFQTMLGDITAASTDQMPERVRLLIANGLADAQSAQKSEFDNLKNQLITGVSISGGGGGGSLALWINVKDAPYSAAGDGVVDDTAAIQSAINDAQATGANGNVVYMPAGIYKITSNLTMTWPNSTTDYDRTGKVYLRGAGSQLTALWDYRTSVGSGGCVSYDFSTTAGPSTPDPDLSKHYMTTWSGGFSIVKKVNFTVPLSGGAPTYPTMGTGVGLYVNRVAIGNFTDMVVIGHDTCIRMIDCLGGAIRDTTVQACNIGIDYAGYSAFSEPTATEVDNITAAGCKTWGIRSIGGGPFTVRDCTLQTNGFMGTTSGNVYYQNPTPIDMAKGITVIDTYFENAIGAADIYIDTPTGYIASVANSVINCGFQRTSGTYYSTNNICVNAVGTTTMELLVQNCGFRGFNSYVPSAGRPCIGLAGTTTNINVTYIANRFFDAVETPAAATLSMGIPARGTRVGDTGSITATADTLTFGSASNSVFVSSVAGAGNQGLFPTVTNSMMLGAGAYRWMNVAAYAADIVNAITWNGYAYAAPTGNTTKFMRNDGTWAVPPFAGAAADGYVSQVAQTFAGQKTFNTAPTSANGYNIDLDTAHSNIAGYYAAIGLNGIAFITGGTTTPTTRAAVTATDIRPNTNNAMTNGTSALRWSNVYSVLGDFSGAITWGGVSCAVPTGGSTAYLNASGTWTIPAGGGGGVTSVTATAPVVSSGGATPVISMAAATGAVDGYVTTTTQTFGGQKTFSVAPTSANGYNVDANTAHSNIGGYFAAIGLNGVAFVSGGSTPVTRAAVTATDIRPNTNNAMTNGTSALRWSNVYSVLGNFSGAITWGAYSMAVPAGSTTTFLRNDGTWATPSGGGTTTNAVTFNNAGAGGVSGSTFNGASALTVSYNTIGAYAASNPSGYTSNTGTVTGVTATAPVVSSGGTAPVISMAAATGAVDGYVTTTTQTFGGQKTFSVAPTSANGYNITGTTAMGLVSGYWFATGASGCKLYVNAVDSYTFDGSSASPTTNNAKSSGASATRWSNVYSILGNFSGVITSSVATGTAPLSIASTTVVPNLNVQYWGGLKLGNAVSATPAKTLAGYLPILDTSGAGTLFLAVYS